MRLPSGVLLLAAILSQGAAGGGSDEGTARHFVYIDYELIWTIEMIGDGPDVVPVINIVTFSKGEWPLKPAQIHIRDTAGRQAKVTRFSMETGADPYITPTFRVLGNSFIGIDLLGDFDGFQEPASITIDLGKYRYALAKLDPLGFERLVDKINKVNFNSPDVREDYEILDIPLLGKRTPRPRDQRQ